MANERKGRGLLIESAAIFFSVLLAFVVEQWREDRNEREQAEATLNLLRAELEQNLAELERIAPTRKAMLEGYMAAMDLSGFIYYINRASNNEPDEIEHVRNAIALLSE
jgi:hypothetical protein